MITSIHFENFFSFSSQTVSLTDLNALIGINGVGKTNFIRAIQLLKATLSEDELPNLVINKWGGFDAMCHIAGRDNRQSDTVTLEYRFSPDVLRKYGFQFLGVPSYRISFRRVASSINYSITEALCDESGNRYFTCRDGKALAKEGREQKEVSYDFDKPFHSALSQLVDKDRYPHIYTLREAIKDIAVYSYFNTAAASPIRKPVPPTSSNRLSSDGTNLPQVLNAIKINSRQNFVRLVEAMRAINPMFVGIDYNILGGNIEMLLEEERLAMPIHVTHVSDGTLRYLCLLAIVFNPKRGRLVCIDEPEVGLHPDMINEIIDVIRDNATDTQFVITTHSEHILNQLSVTNVLVFEKDDDNSTVVKDFKNDTDYTDWAADYALGKLWRNGDLGGNRF